MFDLRVVAVESGYWSGYWSSSKKPKSLKSILTRMLSQYERKNSSKHADTVDVETFLAREVRFKQKQQERA